MSQGVSARNSESGLDTDFKHVSKPQRDQGRLIKESSVMPEWASDEIPAEEIIKGLHIHELHARSGQADVFRGTFAGHVAGELRQVIAKIPTGSEAKALKTFTTEARIIWELSEPGHVNCVRMVAFIESPRPCLVVPFLSGGSLSDFVRQQGQLSNTRRRELALQITSGLDYIHSRNVAHRDIKSQNILLNEQGCAVIIDFGLAVADQKEDALVLIDRVVGTPPFMAPEIMSLMELADFRRSDVYALGIVLFELVSGLSPYGHMSAEWNGLKGSEMNDTLFRFVKGGGQSCNMMLCF
jgi:serine/threonine protein kinase